MNLEQILTSCGLDDKESKVYLANLKLGQSTVNTIAKTSGLKRTTVYFVLNRLQEKSLVNMRQTKKVTYYSTISPSRILTRLQKQTENFREALPELEKLRTPHHLTPKVEMYEGIESMRQAYQEAEKYLSKPDGVLYFGSFKHFLNDERFKDLLDWWIDLLKDKKNKSQELIDSQELSHSTYLEKVTKNGNPNQKIKRIPRQMHFIGNDNLIYGENVALFSVQKEIFVVIIRSKEIANNLRVLFDLAWKKAVKMK